MGIAYYGIKNNSNYVITTDGKLLEVGRNRRFNTSLPTVANTSNWFQITALSNSTPHALAIQSDGTLWTWGGNANGELGLGDTTDRLSPLQIGNLLWKDANSRSLSSLAIQSNGTLWAWGFNNATLGFGGSDNAAKSSPAQIGNLSNWMNIFGYGTTSAAIKTDNTLWVWGSNNNGQLGLSDLTNRSSPVQVGTGSNWSTIAVYDYMLAIQSNGTLWAWGSNLSGELGLGDRTNRSSPVQVGSLSVWTKISNGLFHSAGIQSDGTLWTWGYNASGQLGLNDRTDRSSPVQVGNLSNWTQIFSSTQATKIALQSNGTLWAWGLNSFGQLGLSDSVNRSSPVQVGNLSNWSKISGGYALTYAISSDGDLWAWGNNSLNLLGYSSNSYRSDANQVGSLSSWSKLPGGSQSSAWSLVIDNSNTLYGFGDNTAWRMNYTQATPYYNNSTTYPVGDGQLISLPTPISSNISSVSSGTQCAAFIKTDGTLWTWGLNTFGQIGISGPRQPSYVATPTSGVFVSQLTFDKIQNGTNSTTSQTNFALTNGTIWEWGRNNNFQLGNGGSTNILSPINVLTNLWKEVSSSINNTLAIQTNGTLWVWGINSFGQLGLSDVTHRSTPVQIGSSTWSKASAGGGFHCLAIQSNGTLWAWGLNTFGALGTSDVTIRYSPTQIGTGNNWTQISSSVVIGPFSLAIQSDGTLWSWGNNSVGQLGLSNQTHRSSPTQVGALSVWTQIACGYRFSLALQSNGTLWSWGLNDFGQLGLSNLTNRSSPVQVGTESYWTAISCGARAFCIAIQSNGTLWTWGNNSFGTLGQGDLTHRSSPIQIGTSSNWAQISCGYGATALNSSGKLWIWGDGAANGTIGEDTNVFYSPVQIGSFSDWSQVVYGTYHALALRSGGQLYAWGNNSFGQLGLNDLTNRSTPTQIGTLENWYLLAAGDSFSAAVKYDGTLWAWGNNSFGQLGQGNYTHRSIPAQVGTISQYTSVYAMQNTLLANLL